MPKDGIESEKLLERKLKEAITAKGGLCIKLLSNHFWGLPDRLCLLPGGKMFFAEIKTTNQKRSKIQESVHLRLRQLNFNVYTIDNSLFIKKLTGDDVSI